MVYNGLYAEVMGLMGLQNPLETGLMLDYWNLDACFGGSIPQLYEL